ncbi:MAG TPA: 50S ribosomal protein L6 [Smithellaceae bacterium]|jgi:large subunit ribosomal protein L6|nr:50S ribosomal protein L6 [Syntrophaceae bacterium]NMC92714.1 50S ribosomal protein L6 [Smithella sp.]OQC73532.1 MAG: 50S ribosomal protein L6 [Deltaproteobacteria bacterium ADurb.Bin002]HNV55831.1 50S ribosomal protein L6 [Smithellaceae bacterium]MBP8665490.1 50S ribosomal protein L6 [Syntrophaceae bacterium]
MSRIGKKPIAFPKNVKISQNGNIVKVEGPKGTLSSKLPDGIAMTMEENQLIIERKSDDRLARSYHGLARTLVNNMVTGVSAGFEKGLEISGVGYRAELAGSNLKLVLGFSSPVEYSIPKGIEVRIDKQVNLVVSGIDKELVGRVASEIRSLKKPEPYKGKGIKYAGEHIRRKAGKAAGAK